MKRLLNQTNGVYYLLEGPYGSGKTTAFLLAAEDIGNNIVYVSAEDDFGMSLARKFSMCEESPSHMELVLAYLQFPMQPKCPTTLRKSQSLGEDNGRCPPGNVEGRKSCSSPHN